MAEDSAHTRCGLLFRTRMVADSKRGRVGLRRIVSFIDFTFRFAASLKALSRLSFTTEVDRHAATEHQPVFCVRCPRRTVDLLRQRDRVILVLRTIPADRRDALRGR